MGLLDFLSRRPLGNRGSRPPRAGFAPMLQELEGRELLTAYFVTNTSSSASVQGSLPWAVQQANEATRGLDYIDFRIGGGGAQAITLDQALHLNDQVVVDGTTQPGYAGTPLISVRGTTAVDGLFLLQADPSRGTTSTGSTIQGLDMADYMVSAVTIVDSSTDNWIQNNWIGFYVDDAGPHATTAFAPSGSHPAGLSLLSSSNTIRRDVIAGLHGGIVVGEDIAGTWDYAVYKSNSIQQDRIGTYPDGVVASSGFGNASDGIFLGAGAKDNFLGPDDVLSGNACSGVAMLHPSVTGNAVFRSRIGTNNDATAAIPNGQFGVLIANGASYNTIGLFDGNIISGNVLGGVSLGADGYPVAPGHNYVENNIIGLDGDQTSVIGTQGVGIAIRSDAASNSVVCNVIAGLTSHGVVMAGTRGNYVAQNWIGRPYNGIAIANGGYGVALLAGASYNFVESNATGDNRLGKYYIDPDAIGNQTQ